MKEERDRLRPPASARHPSRYHNNRSEDAGSIPRALRCLHPTYHNMHPFTSRQIGVENII